ncbi:MAG TPA: hypothetical protein VFO76_11635 [Candidatus Kapabacteria bacterium]|nr:hypothetical protein [Candidatus Kapabacteria bacterium]
MIIQKREAPGATFIIPRTDTPGSTTRIEPKNPNRIHQDEKGRTSTRNSSKTINRK